jgi:hypothetical protein
MRFTRWFDTAPLRLRSIFRRRQVEQELDCDLPTGRELFTLPIERSPTLPVHDFIYSSYRLEASDSGFQFTTLFRFRQSTRYAKSII